MSCQIFIDTPGPFYAGNLIQGRLVCNFSGYQKIRGIKIRAYGDEHTEWWGTESYYNHHDKRHETRSVMYTGDNNLFSLESMLFGSQHGETHINPGSYTYPFSFQLPSNLPSTFENSYGHIRYTLKGIVDIPWGMDYEDKVHFVLVSLIDLNNFPQECFQPTSRSDEKTVCCWCCAGGEITVDININKTAFIPGEKIKLYVALTNMSNSNIDSLEAKFTQYIRSQVQTPSHETKMDETELARDTWSGVGAHGENKYDIEIPIPTDIGVPNLDRSSLFDVNYDIEITANISGCHNDVDLSFSLNLGHLQHHGQMAGSPSQQPQFGGRGYPHSAGGDASSPPYPGMMPTAPGAPYPSGPQYPASGYPPTAPGFVMPPSGEASAPAPYPTGPVNYASQPGYPGTMASAPGLNPKEREANDGSGAPPFHSVAPPPSYDEITKKS